MEKKMETTIGYNGLYRDYYKDSGLYRFWGFNEGMEKKMETTIVGYIGFRVSGLGFGRNGKEHENNYNGLYRDHSN